MTEEGRKGALCGDRGGGVRRRGRAEGAGEDEGRAWDVRGAQRLDREDKNVVLMTGAGGT